MAFRLMESQLDRLPFCNIYRLAFLITTHSLIEEYRLRALRFPTVTEETVYQSSSRLRKILADRDPKAAMIYQTSLLRYIEQQNPNLVTSFWALEHALGSTIDEKQQRRDLRIAIMNALSQSYESIAYQAKIEGIRVLN